MKFSPLTDKVVVRVIENNAVSKGGIILADIAKGKPQKGEVLAVGPGATNEKGVLIPMEVKVGDKILYIQNAGSTSRIDNVEYLFLRESDILGVLE